MTSSGMLTREVENVETGGTNKLADTSRGNMIVCDAVWMSWNSSFPTMYYSSNNLVTSVHSAARRRRCRRSVHVAVAAAERVRTIRFCTGPRYSTLCDRCRWRRVDRL